MSQGSDLTETQKPRGVSKGSRAAILLVGLVVGASAIGYALKLPARALGFGFVLVAAVWALVIFFQRDRTGRWLSARRFLVMFVIIPLIAGAVVFLFFEAGIADWLGVWLFSGLILLCNLIFFLLFDTERSH